MPWRHHQTLILYMQIDTGEEKLGDAIIDSCDTLETRLPGANQKGYGCPCLHSTQERNARNIHDHAHVSFRHQVQVVDGQRPRLEMRSYLIAASKIFATRSQLCISTARGRSFTCKTSPLHFVFRAAIPVEWLDEAPNDCRNPGLTWAGTQSPNQHAGNASTCKPSLSLTCWEQILYRDLASRG